MKATREQCLAMAREIYGFINTTEEQLANIERLVHLAQQFTLDQLRADEERPIKLFGPATNKADLWDLAMKCGVYIDFFGGFVGASTIEERRFTPHNHEECAEAVILAAAEIWRSRK